MIRNFNLVKNLLRTQGDRLDEMAETLGRLQAKDKQEEKDISLATNLLHCSTGAVIIRALLVKNLANKCILSYNTGEGSWGGVSLLYYGSG